MDEKTEVEKLKKKSELSTRRKDKQKTNGTKRRDQNYGHQNNRTTMQK